MPSRCLLNLARKRRWSCFKENVLNQSNKRESEPGGHCVSVWLPRLSQTILTGGGEHQQGGAGAGRASLAFRTQYFRRCISSLLALCGLHWPLQGRRPHLVPLGLGQLVPQFQPYSFFACVHARACSCTCVCIKDRSC